VLPGENNDMKGTMSPFAVPRTEDFRGWEAKLRGEVPVLGSVIERL